MNKQQRAHNTARELSSQCEGHRRAIRDLEDRIRRFLHDCDCWQCVNMCANLEAEEDIPEREE